ncbi:MAG: hypothetical protein V7603_2599 [Micromonosporaceae bacterium]
MRTEPIVGRAGELRVLDGMLDGLASGPATACVIVGEAGMGKSALWRHGVAGARERGYRVLSCRPAAPAAAMPFAGLIELLDVATDAFGQLPAPQRRVLEVALLRVEADGSPPAAQAVGIAVLTLVRWLVDAGPVLIAVDDAQRLDPATAAVLGYLARQVGAEPVGLLLAVCGRDNADQPDPLELADALAEGRVHRVRVDRLELAELRQLIAAHTGLALSRPELLRLDEACEGNPFGALQIAAALAGGQTATPGGPLPVSRRWRDAVQDQLRAVPEPTRRVLLYAAALAQPSAAQIRAALGEPGPLTPGLAEAEQAGLLRVDDGQVRFTPAMLGLAVYATAGGEQRRAAHWRLAEAVPDLEQRARHLALATDCADAAVADTLDEAARHAQARGAPGVAADLWLLAGGRTPAGDDRACRRLVAAARWLLRTGDCARSRMVLEQAFGVARGRDRAYVLLWLASVTFEECGPRPAVTVLRDALALAAGDPQLTAALHLRMAWFADGDLDLRLAGARAALTGLDRPDAAAELRAAAVITAAYVGFLAGRGVDHAAVGRGAALLPDRDFSWEVDAGRSALTLMAGSEDLTGTRDAWQARLDRDREIGDEVGIPHAWYHLARTECWLGAWPVAAQRVEDLMEAVEQTGQRRLRILALYLRAWVAAHRGDGTAAGAAIGAGLKLAEQLDDPVATGLHLAVRGFLDLSCGDAPAADRHLARASALLHPTGAGEPTRFAVLGDRVEAAVTVGALDRAGDLLTQLRQCAAAPADPWLRVVTARSHAQAAMAAGELPEAVAAIDEAHAAHQHLAVPFELARTHLVHGQILRRMRQRRAAEQALRRAETGFTRLGAALWIPQASAELRRLGLHRTASGHLTPTETQVAGLVADGRSNIEVAAALRISRRTVENHLGHIYGKLGVATRAAMAGALRAVNGAAAPH